MLAIAACGGSPGPATSTFTPDAGGKDPPTPLPTVDDDAMTADTASSPPISFADPDAQAPDASSPDA
ncbi:MAG: thioredoxin, partial [Myxococcota bacterium]|nr:thioredoxin [Myxococcota bacterium]